MSGAEQSQQSGVWYTINEGKFKRKVTEDTPGAIRRDWETPDGKSGTKWELHYNALFGVIENIKIQDGDYGKTVNVYLDKDENDQTPIVSFSLNSKYGIDFLKKLPNIKLDQEVRLMPFNFKNDKDEEVTGVRVDHKDEEEKFKNKVDNYFFNGTKTVNGYPEPVANAKEIWDKADWKNYFTYTVPKFLVAYATDNVLPKFSNVPVSQGNSMPDYPEDEIRPEDIPF